MTLQSNNNACLKKEKLNFLWIFFEIYDKLI